jgi:hypothetical protein
VTPDRNLAGELGATIAQDVASLLSSEASIGLTVDGTPARGILREYFGQVDDPRAPEVYLPAAVLPAAGQHGASVQIGAEYFAIEGVRPVAPGLVRVLLAASPAPIVVGRFDFSDPDQSGSYLGIF